MKTLELNDQSPMYSIVVPVYNASKTLKTLIEEIETNMSIYDNYEIVLVDDCSRDASWQLMKELKAHKPHLKIYRLSRNFGQAGSTLCGIYKAKGKTIITIDDDLQYPASEIPKMIKYFETHDYYMVLGIAEHKAQPKRLKIAEKFVRLFFKIKPIGHINGASISSSFRIFSSKFNRSEDHAHGRVFSTHVATYLFDPQFIGQTVVQHTSGKNRRSRYSFLTRLDQFLDILLLNYTNPLRFLLLPTLLLIIGAVMGVILDYLFHISIPQIYLSLLQIGMSGVILFTMIIMGMYLSRIYGRQQGTVPFFVIEYYD